MFYLTSYNVRGLQQKSKRLKIFSYIADKLSNNGLFCFQECHSTPSLEEKWSSEWGGRLIFSHGQSNARGVAIGFTKNFDCSVNNIYRDVDGRILILEVSKDDDTFLLINFYNANSESEQIKALHSLDALLSKVDLDQDFKPILMGDMNLIFDTKLDALGGTPSLKKRSLVSLLKLLSKLDVSDIFRIRFPDRKRFTFRQKIGNCVIHRRLDYIFLANNLQEYAKDIRVLPSFLSDHSPVLFNLSNLSANKRGRGVYKFNNSLLYKDNFDIGMRHTIQKTIQEHSYCNPHMLWELVKYEARKYSIKFSKNLAMTSKVQKKHHEDIVTSFESSPNTNVLEEDYDNSKNWLHNWYEEYTKGVILRSKSDWYEQGEKSTKYFLNLEKNNYTKNTVRKILIGNTEVDDDEAILDHAKSFYESLFFKKCDKSSEQCQVFLSNITTPTLSSANRAFCDSDLTLDELSKSLDSMASGKSPGNDGLTIEFYKFFWDDLKTILYNSALYSKTHGSLSSSQRQAIIKLLEKKDKDKRHIENWRPISLLNVDTKIISKALASRLKEVLPDIISHDQTAYVRGRFIGESTRLISDILEFTDLYNIEGYILTADLEKAFDSMDHTFLLATLKKFGFGEYYIDWIRVLLNNNESCIINGGITSKYFKLLRGARQGDPIAAYLFIISLEVFFIMLRSNTDIKQLNIFGSNFLLSAYADDTTFFVQDIDSISIIFDIFGKFSSFSGFKLNMSKCEVSGIGALKGVATALCGVKNVDLCESFIKILGFNFSYNRKLSCDKNFVSILNKIVNTLNVWKMRQLTLIGKIVIFKTLAISKIVYVSSICSIPKCILDELNKMHKEFIWDNKKAKIKHSTLIGNYSDGGLRDIDIDIKIKALQLSWLKRFYDSNFHPWKSIPSYIFGKISACDSLFFPNLMLNKVSDIKIPKFYQDILSFWSDISSSTPYTASSILSESIWHNRYLQIGNKAITPSLFQFKVRSLFVSDFFDSSGDILDWNRFKSTHSICDAHYFRWLQIIHALPKVWKNAIKADGGKSRIFCDFTPHLIVKAKIYPMDKLSSKMIYSILLASKFRPPSSQRTFLALLKVDSLPWNKIYTLPWTISIDSYSRIFQYKCLNNILFLNKSLFRMGITDTPLCSYCNQNEETMQHLFIECCVSKKLWSDIKTLFSNSITVPDLTLQSAFFGFYSPNKDTFALNNILLIFKICMYRFRGKKQPDIQLFVKNLRERERMERQIVLENEKKLSTHFSKWFFINHLQ